MPKVETFFKKYKREILVVILLLAAFMPTILWMWERWFAPGSYYSHGILIPLVSLFLIWQKKDVIKKLPKNSSPWGLRLFVLGIIIYWASAVLQVYFTSAFSMLIVLAGLILYFYGEKTFKEIMFPFLFLIFMVPLPLIVVATITFKLKILAAKLATTILNKLRLPAIQQASLIIMRHTYVLVEDACGGLKSLIALTALGCIFAYQLKAGFFKKMTLFVSAIPIAVITNALRIVFLAAVGEIWGAKYTHGVLHSLSGFLVFVFAYLSLLFIEWLLESIK